MAVGLDADVHVPGPAIQQLRRRGVDVLAATEAGTHEMPDHELLALATSLQRVMVTCGTPKRAGRSLEELTIASLPIGFLWTS